MNTNKTDDLEIRIGDITFDVLSPKVMAEFWAAALHYEIQEISDDFSAVVDPKGKQPRCCFQKVLTPKTGKNRIHLDLHTENMKADVDRLEALGAQKLHVAEENGVVWTVMLDVEHNEFCVQPPQ